MEISKGDILSHHGFNAFDWYFVNWLVVNSIWIETGFGWDVSNLIRYIFQNTWILNYKKGAHQVSNKLKLPTLIFLYMF